MAAQAPIEELPAEHPTPLHTISSTGPADHSALLPWIDDVLAVGNAPIPDGHRATTHESGVPKRVADSGQNIPHGAKYDPRWVAMAHNVLDESAAPSSVRLPDQIVRGLDDAWARSQQSDHEERGGNIVKTARTGEYDYRPGGDTRPGDRYGWTPDRSDVGFKQDFIGTYHTHDSTHDKPAYDSVGFSDGDISNLATMEDHLKLVRSGADTYMLARTKEFDQLAKQYDDGDPAHLAKFQREIEATYNAAYNKVYNGDPRNHQAATEAGTQAAAQTYHLLYYKGQGAMLQRAGAAATKK